MSKSVEERLTEVVTNIFPEFKPGVSFDSMGMDSLDLSELVLETEKEFNIDISENDAQALAKGTFYDLLTFVNERLGQ